MLYEKNKEKRLSEDLFREPTSEYRGAPFWSWNDELDEAECVRQAHIFREMGFGGYHMHPRAGLATPYLGEKFNSCVRACVDDAKKTGMLAWLYDEDRYPSGFAGGYVTKDGRFRRRGLVFTREKMEENATYAEGRQTSGVKLLASYAVRLRCGQCLGYKRLTAGEKGNGKIFYAYLVVDEPTDQFNGAGYVDALNKEALDLFAEYTYGTYQKTVGDEFGKTVPAIFTDEPQMKFVSPFKHPCCRKKAVLPWTDDFVDGYKATYGTDVLDVLPELFFDVDTPTVYRTRYAYHTYRTARFAEAFNDNLGAQAEKYGIALTGHMMEEPTLESQSKAVGECMRQYKNYGIPGIDMLCGRHEYTTAKQAESVVRQEWKEGMMCELYGVSRWVAEFAKFKEEGDWLACLGVTVRVPHLSYYSMRGEAKRDYPPSIFYQAPWYLKFKKIEDHFARLNTVLTRGKALNDVAVIHPIESYFLYLAAGKTSKEMGNYLNKRFLDLADWLLFDGYDFDYISESLLPLQRQDTPFSVGECKYKTIIVPDLVTMRRSTLDYLISFRMAGGKVLFLGTAPTMLDGMPSDEVARFAEGCEVVPFEQWKVLDALEDCRYVKVESEKREEEYLATLREDDGGRWLFVTAPRRNFPYPHSVPVTNEKEVVRDTVRIGVKGEWKVTRYDTLTGEIEPMSALTKDGVTYVDAAMYNNDSLLLRYEAGENEGKTFLGNERGTLRTVTLAGGVPYTLDEPNALLLDKAAWSIGSGFNARCDVDLADIKMRRALGLARHRNDLQPWLREGGATIRVTLRFEVKSTIDTSAKFACEYNDFTLTVNGEKATAPMDGYYVDRVIRTTPVSLKKGRNVIDIAITMSEFDRLENCYLLGEFGVELKGTKGKIVPLPERIEFKDLAAQKMPFYSGKITYHATFDSDGETAELSARYASALLSVRVNDEEKDILFAPYAAAFPTKKGINTLDITAYAPRENAFGAVHIIRKFKRSDSPSWYHKTSLPWRVRRYVLDPAGILESPVIRFFE